MERNTVSILSLLLIFLPVNCYANSGIGSPDAFILITAFIFMLISGLVYSLYYSSTIKKRKSMDAIDFMMTPLIIIFIFIVVLMQLRINSLVVGAVLGSVASTVIYYINIKKHIKPNGKSDKNNNT